MLLVYKRIQHDTPLPPFHLSFFTFHLFRPHRPKMWSRNIILLTLAFIAARVHGASTAKIQEIYARGLIGEGDVQSSYDYIVAGGGLAGLVVASRLTADASTTVLVLEAGKSGDDVASQINPPSGTYYTSIVNSEYDWRHVTVPQPNFNNRSVGWPQGKVLGGSSAMNGMYLVRPSKTEMDAWKDLIAPEGDLPAANNWAWETIYGYMKKSENFTAPSPALSNVVNISYDASTHGSGGPMQVSFPRIIIDIVGNWTSSLETIGVPKLTNPNGGVTLGGFIAPSSINPANWTRSYSRSAYIDSLTPRSNLHILPQATVVRLDISDEKDSAGNLYVKNVEFASDSAAVRKIVKVNKEVILAGGALGSPKILMHSGVGPKDVLEAASVAVKLELPGVGQNLQDHPSAAVVWETPLETAGDIHDSQSDFSKSPEFLSCINDAVAFINSSALFIGQDTSFQTAVLEALEESSKTLVRSQYLEVVEGYKAVYSARANKFFPNVAQLEMLLGVMSPGIVSIQTALQHPYSIGHAYINSSDPFDPIIINPQYFSHFADVVMMRQGVKFVRTVAQAFGAAFGNETSPGPGVQTDDQIEDWLVSSAASTGYHPSGTCAMLPKSQGGVVNAKLQVYGLGNVRVVDSSVFPFEFAAHLASATYGVAELAAVLIESNSYNVPLDSTPASTSQGSRTSWHPLALSTALLFIVQYLIV